MICPELNSMNTLSKFIRIINKYGSTDDEANEYLNSKVFHDQHVSSLKFIHVYSKIPHEFQMDTWIGDPDY